MTPCLLSFPSPSITARSPSPRMPAQHSPGFPVSLIEEPCAQCQDTHCPDVPHSFFSRFPSPVPCPLPSPSMWWTLSSRPLLASCWSGLQVTHVIAPHSIFSSPPDRSLNRFSYSDYHCMQAAVLGCPRSAKEDKRACG